MRKFLLVIVYLAIFAASPLMAFAAEVKNIEIIEFGIYEAKDINKAKAGTLASGVNYQLTDINLVKKTDRIPATLGTRFGMRYLVRGNLEGQTVTVIHRKLVPGFKQPAKDTIVYQEEYETEASIGNLRYWGYTFREEWELVPGKWAFQIVYKGNILAEKTFIVYKP